MASDQKFVDYILDQIDMPKQVSCKKMFGEYGLYFEDKLFGLVCDNKLFIKPVAGRNFACQASSPVSGTMRALDVTPREIVARLQRLGVST